MEMEIIRRTAYLRAFNANLNNILVKLIVFLTFVFYSSTGNALTSEKVFEINELNVIWHLLSVSYLTLF